MSNVKTKVKNYVLLHILFLFYSLVGIFSKLASQHDFLSMEFILFYGMVLLDLGVYAIFWQQVLKKLPLTTAFSNKAITIVWGMLWGILFFGECVSLVRIFGATLIVGGIIYLGYVNE